MAKTIHIPMTEEEFWERAEKIWEEHQRIARLRKERPWTFDIIRVLWGTTSFKSMAMLTHQLWTIRNPSGLPMPKRFTETVQSCLNRHVVSLANRKMTCFILHKVKGRELGPFVGMWQSNG
jgi:hypothetical protein